MKITRSLLILLTVGAVQGFHGLTGLPEDIAPPLPKSPGTTITGSASSCPNAAKYGSGPPASCAEPTDPLKKPASALESWFTRDKFDDLFPFANIGWGPNKCFPYSYESFVIAARYFPDFGTVSPNQIYTADQNKKRDLAAFFAHAVQETGENNANLYTLLSGQQAANCFYRGGFYNWFEGGPVSPFLDNSSPGYTPADGNQCNNLGRYCAQSAELNYFYGCSNDTGSVAGTYKGCYFGRGAVQISYNFNYGMFQNWLKSQGIVADLLANPNLVMTKMDPPLAIMASLWFYMTPQPPKPAMHDIIMGDWAGGAVNDAAGYAGPIFGPTSLIINNECNGEDAANPGGAGESRRIKAFKWFCQYFGVAAGDDFTLTCKTMPVKFNELAQNKSYQPDWSTTWKEQPCACAPALSGGMIPYFDPNLYPPQFVKLNAASKVACEDSIYDNPSMYSLEPNTSPCLNHPRQ